MLDKQDEDRTREFNQRERRAQEFMNNLATKVISKQTAKKQAEDEALAKYEHDREMRMRLEDERRVQREAAEKAQMRELLFRQVQEKKNREAAEKASTMEQADIWRRDKENYEEEERRLKNKIAAINAENSEFLKKQMEEKSKKGAKNMSREEFAYNKDLLAKVNGKLKQSET